MWQAHLGIYLLLNFSTILFTCRCLQPSPILPLADAATPRRIKVYPVVERRCHDAMGQGSRAQFYLPYSATQRTPFGSGISRVLCRMARAMGAISAPPPPAQGPRIRLSFPAWEAGKGREPPRGEATPQRHDVTMFACHGRGFVLVRLCLSVTLDLQNLGGPSSRRQRVLLAANSSHHEPANYSAFPHLVPPPPSTYQGQQSFPNLILCARLFQPHTATFHNCHKQGPTGLDCHSVPF